MKVVVTRFVARHDLALFLGVTLALSWGLWLASGILARSPRPLPDRVWWVAQLGVFAPGLTAALLAALSGSCPLRRPVGVVLLVYLPAAWLGAAIAGGGFTHWNEVGPPWTGLALGLVLWISVVLASRAGRLFPWPLENASRGAVAALSALALVGPPALFAIAWGIVGPVGTKLDPARVAASRELAPVAVLEALVVNLLFGGSLGEEPGWRGFLLPRLLRDRSPLAASLVLSFWWALWHAPIDVVQGFGLPGPLGLFARQLWTAPIAVLFTWFTLRAGGGLLPPLLLHTSLNSLSDFGLRDPPRYMAATGLFFVLTLAVAIAVGIADARLRRWPDPAALRPSSG